MRLLLLLLLLVAGCSDNSDESNDYYMLRQSTMSRLFNQLEKLEAIEHQKGWNIEQAREDVRSEINEASICKKVLKDLKDRNETMKKESWLICENIKKYARPYSIFKTIPTNR